MIHIEMMKGSTRAPIFYKQKLNEKSKNSERIKGAVADARRSNSGGTEPADHDDIDDIHGEPAKFGEDDRYGELQ